jgi:hypothetical protein
MRCSGKIGAQKTSTRIAILFLIVVFLGGILPQGSRWSSSASATTLNRRFTQNPYVPPLVVGEQVDVAKQSFKCPKAMIFGFRGSGEQPDEFLVKDAITLNTTGQKYSNWNRTLGFVDKKGYYTQSKYMSSKDQKFYSQIFGKTVGVHVLTAREAIAKSRGWSFSDIGIWSVGVDDLEFSTETPPQSAYHAPEINWKVILNWNKRQNYLLQLDRTVFQLEGFAIPGIDSNSQISNLYYALLLLGKFCPRLEGVHLIGYSQGAVIARYMAGSSLIKNMTKPTLPSGMRSSSLFLIADPLFDGSEYKWQRSLEMLPSIYDDNSDKLEAYEKARGALQRLGRCGPHMTQNKKCTFQVESKDINNPSFISLSYTPLTKEFEVQTLCVKNDLVCAPGLSTKGEAPHKYYNLKSDGGKATKELVYGRICYLLWLCS